MKLSEKAEKRIAEILPKYPDKKSAVMPALYIAQEEMGYVTSESVNWVAEKVGLSPVHVMEVATFYTMFYKKPVGKYHFQVCRTLSCALRGAKKITDHIADRLGTETNEVTADGMWSYEEVECLGSCGTAPMCQLNDVYFENLTIEKIDELMKKVAADKPDLRFSTVKDSLGEGLPKEPRSQVI